MAKKKKRKRVSVRLAKRRHAGKITEPYQLMDVVMREKRTDLEKAKVKIGIAWNAGWRSDADGHLVLAKCSKRKDLDRELADYDFIIILNEDVWPHLEDGQKYRLIWHQLCHAELRYDSDGSPLKDDRDRIVCRIRAHDIEEFKEIGNAYGFEHDFNVVVKATINDARRPLLNLPANSPDETKSMQKATNKKKTTRKKRTVGSIQKTVTATE